MAHEDYATWTRRVARQVHGIIMTGSRSLRHTTSVSQSRHSDTVGPKVHDLLHRAENLTVENILMSHVNGPILSQTAAASVL